MPVQPPTSIPRKDLARGIDSHSSKGNIPEGYAEDLENLDTSAGGQLTTRPGYEGYYGWLPLRVVRATQVDASTLKLEFANSQVIDLTTAKVGPIVIGGRTSRAHTGAFGGFDTTTSYAHWYDSFALTSFVSYTAGSGTVTQTAAQHGYTDANFWVGAAEITVPFTTSNAAITPDDLQIDSATYQVDLAYTVATSVSGYLFYRDQTAAAGLRYHTAVATGASKTVSSYDAATNVVTTSTVHGLVAGDPFVIQGTGTPGAGLSKSTTYFVKTVPTTATLTVAAYYGGPAIDVTGVGSGTTTLKGWGKQIPSGTHNLDTFNILVRVVDTATVVGKACAINPDDITINDDGTVHIIPLDPSSADTFTGTAYLEAVPTTQIKNTTATVTGGGPTLNTFTIAAPGSPYLYFSVYRYNTTAAQFEEVDVDSWTYDSVTDTATVDYYLSGSTGELVDIYWTTGQTIANAITVTHAGTAGVDEAPELTVWGIDHAGIYLDTTARGGHVTHLDAYKRVGERRLVAGLGGNLFRALAYSEGYSTWAMGTLLTQLAARVSADVIMAPLFWTTNPGTVRTRGVVFDATVVNNAAVVTAATYVSAGVTDYTLTFTNKTGSIAIGSAVSAADYLTVSGLAHAEHSGTWLISSVQSDSATQTVIRVAHPSAKLSLNETSAMGRAAVATDQFVTQAAPNWIPGDVLVGSTVVAAGVTLPVLSAATTTVVVSGLMSSVQLAAGERIGVRRTTQAVPTRLASGAASVASIVPGDMLAVSSINALDRRPRALAVQTQATQAATLTGDGTTVTVSVAAAHRLNVGDVAVLYGAVAGEHTVLSTPSTLTFTVAGTALSAAATLQGCVVQLDEAIVVEDSPEGITALAVDGRWAPIEAPYTAADLPADTWYNYLAANSVVDQPALRSTIIQDAMYFTNGDDEVMKFDGTYLCRAGLPRWQPGLFATNDTAATAKLGVDSAVAFSSKSAAGLYFVTATVPFAVGDYIYENTAKLVWLVDKIVTIPGATETYQITVAPGSDISGAGVSGTLTKVSNFKYYFKFNLIDRNQVIVASYAAQSEDFVVAYSTAGQIKLRLVGPPAFGAYDYDRVELETYRTEADGALYYLHSRQPVDFDRADGYIDIADATSDAILAPGTGAAHGAVNRDVTMTRLLGNELGTGWDQPPRASCVTSLNNCLVLGNLTGYPESNLVFRAAPGQPGLAATALAGQILTFRKDSTLSGTTTDMVNVVRFEFMNSGEVTIVPANITRTSTTVVIPKVAHGLAVGQWVYLFQSAAVVGKTLQASGWWQVTAVPTADTFTLTVNNAYSFSATDCDRYVTATTKTDVPVWLGTDGNLQMRDGNPAANTEVTIQAASRLAMAINASQRQTTVVLGARAWLSAFAGQDQGSGHVQVVSPVALATTPGIVSSTPAATAKLYVDGVDFSVNAYAKSFVAKRFPSRIAASLPNYPDLFDNPLATDAVASRSLIDVNPADGQAVTAVIPFFGEGASAGSNAALAAVCVVVKEQSVYLANVVTREVTKINTRGMGGTAPRAVFETQGGIGFVNESGVYRLNRDMTITPMGLLMSGKVKTALNKAQITEAHAHHWAQGRRVKISVPVDGETYPTEVWVYDYEREGKGQEHGAWTRYTEHPACGWANLGAEAYWASRSGDVFQVRARGEAPDYRDEDGAVAEAVATLRAEDFGLPGVRKVFHNVTPELELPLTDVTGLTIATATNLSRTFETEGAPIAVSMATFQQVTFRTALAQRRGTRIQVQFRHQTKDECLNLTGVTYTVGSLSAKLVPEQADQT